MPRSLPSIFGNKNVNVKVQVIFIHHTEPSCMATPYYATCVMLRRGILTVRQINMHQITNIVNYVCRS